MDGELSGGKREEIRLHLEECSRCRSILEAQRRLETVWREDWKDPSDAAFNTMRRRLANPAPWWRKQRTWFAVAAVFSIYLGVKIFYLDGRGTSLSELALEEEAPNELRSEDELFRDTQEVFVTGEVYSEEAFEPVEQIELEVEEETADIEGATGTAEASFVTSTSNLSDDRGDLVSAAYGESLDQPVEEGFAGGLGGIIVSDEIAVEMEETPTEPVSTGDSPELIVEDSTVYLNMSAGGGGSGGTGYDYYGSVSRSVQESDDSACNDMELASIAACPGSEVQQAHPDHIVCVTLQGGETIYLCRSDWEDLFMFIDTISTGESLFIRVDSTGSAEGPAIPDGTELTAPEEKYVNSTIVIYTY